ncbi:hypothetical protein CEXT_76431 [Caerostris extrusa]|uniref:Uncharacterized protein n=1 Tax=Caerostris extrusa TaxID=172846 RepID=A0AAV4QFR6_CAEEX|nr:hypothetical protein CEXT_76431 [Caerostris extrusa]
MGEGSSNLLSRRGRTMPLTRNVTPRLLFHSSGNCGGNASFLPDSGSGGGGIKTRFKSSLPSQSSSLARASFENFIGKLMRNYFGISFVMGFCGFISARDWGFESLCSVSAIVDL